MNDSVAIRLGQEAILTTLLVAGPMLGFSLVVGLLVTFFQATTQLQEQTLSFVPKILAVFAAAFLFGPWMMRVMMDYAVRILGNLHAFVG